MAESTSTQPIFPRLSSGPRKMEAEAVARHQRGRLEGAMVELVAQQGFEATTLRELVSLAGVSKSTFYEHFESKQECFLATFDDIQREVSRQVREAFDRSDDLRGKLREGLTIFTKLAAEQPAAASLITVESLTLGAAAVPNRERASADFEALIAEAFAGDAGAPPVSELTVRGIVAGIRNLAYQTFRHGDPAQLPEFVDAMVEWVLSYARPAGEPADRALAAYSRKRPHAGEPIAPPPPDRDDVSGRIARAAAELAVEKGYDGLSIPAISAAAGVSNKTFYDRFPGKREAFTAGFDTLAKELLVAVAGSVAGEESWPESIGAGLRTLLERAAGDELFARLAFFELPMAGPAALDHADQTLGGFAAFLGPAEEQGGAPLAVKESIVGGTWAVIQHEFVSGRGTELVERGPEICEFVMAPFASIGESA